MKRIRLGLMMLFLSFGVYRIMEIEKMNALRSAVLRKRGGFTKKITYTKKLVKMWAA